MGSCLHKKPFKINLRLCWYKDKIQAGSCSFFLLLWKEMKAFSWAPKSPTDPQHCTRWPIRELGPVETVTEVPRLGQGPSCIYSILASCWNYLSLYLILPLPMPQLNHTQEKRLSRLSLQPQHSLAHSKCSIHNCWTDLNWTDKDLGFFKVITETRSKKRVKERSLGKNTALITAALVAGSRVRIWELIPGKFWNWNKMSVL